ncbi:MAG: GNAT family N-acetyltransferase, partial [Candidatus Moraniibacteriota bacterium]
VHDVVVNNKFREHGIGRALMKEAIASAKQAGAKYIELTSNPGRKAANKLYRSIGFVCIARANSGGGQGTNLYRLEL